MTPRQKKEASVRLAKRILADIYFLTNRHPEGQQELSQATDAIYKYIDEIKPKKGGKNDSGI